MNVCVVGKANHLLWDSHVAKAFKELNHNVLHYQINNRDLILKVLRSGIKIFNKQFSRELTDKIAAEDLYQQCLRFKPDIIFITSAFFIPIIFYKLLKELPNKTIIVAWDGDTALRYEHNSIYAEYIDVLMSATKYYADNKIISFPNTHHLMLAANTDFFYQGTNHIRKVYFCAECTIERNFFITQLPFEKIIVKGKGWDEIKHQNIINKTISLKEVANDYRLYALTLNMHQIANAPYGGLNMRTFEASASGSVVLSDDRSELSLAYEPNKEILVYRDVEEALMHIEKTLYDINYINKIRENAYKKTKAEHTYTKRMMQALEIVREY